MPARRFPPPWSVEDIGVAFKVSDSTGQRLAYFYFEEEPGGFNARAMSQRRFAMVALSSSLKPRAAAESLQRPLSRVVH